MKKVLVVLLSVILVAVVFAACNAPEPEPTQPAPPKPEAPKAEPEGGAGGETGYRVGLSFSSLEAEFFTVMAKEAERYAPTIGVDLTITDAHDSNEQQLDQVQNLIAMNLDAIIYNPIDSDAGSAGTKEMNAAGIPVFTITRNSNEGEVVSHVDSDNVTLARAVADQVIADTGGAGKMVILEGRSGATSAVNRAQGFQDGIEGHSFEILQQQTANYSREEANVLMDDILQANPVIDILFAHNDEMALGAIRAIEAAGRSGDGILIYGIDATVDARQAIRDGQMKASVSSGQDSMMRIALDNVVAYLNGGSVDPLYYGVFKVITIDNVDE